MKYVSIPSGVVRFKQVAVGPMKNFAYLFADDAGEGLLVDPAWDAPLPLREAEAAGILVRAILATHGHTDHVIGIAPSMRWSVPIFGLHTCPTAAGSSGLGHRIGGPL